MSKLMVVARREFRETVRKRSFVILTILLPILFGGLVTVPSILIQRSAKEKKVLILDGTGALEARLRQALAKYDDDDEPVASPQSKAADGKAAEKSDQAETAPTAKLDVEIRATADPAADGASALEQLKERSLDAVVLLPKALLAGTESGTYYSRSTTDLATRRRITTAVSQAVTESRLEGQGVAATDVARILERVQLESVQIKRSGETKSSGGADFILGFLFAMMMFVPLVFHGQGILHSVIQEKSDRIVETLVSSMTAFDLLTGKVLGLAAVGLLQIAIWSTMGFAISTLASGTLLSMGINPLTLITPLKLLLFVIYFLLGYFIYACVYAAGGACVNSEKEAQQALMPVFLILFVPWMLMASILADPDGALATGFSLAPVYAPLTMFVRIVVTDPPPWQIAASIAVSLATILALFWLAARIFRVGILWYGKRPSLPEFVRWLRHP